MDNLAAESSGESVLTVLFPTNSMISSSIGPPHFTLETLNDLNSPIDPHWLANKSCESSSCSWVNTQALSRTASLTLASRIKGSKPLKLSRAIKFKRSEKYSLI